MLYRGMREHARSLIWVVEFCNSAPKLLSDKDFSLAARKRISYKSRSCQPRIFPAWRHSRIDPVEERLAMKLSLRPLILPTALLSLAICSSPAVSVATAQTPPVVDGEKIKLKEMLEKGLKVVRPEDFAFVAHVVQLVDDGTLPRDLVDSTFQWARRKPRFRAQYFEHGLRARAAAIGVPI
jgi:hypothetical protein